MELNYMSSSPCPVRASANDARGASHDSADNPTGDSTKNDNAVRSNRDIRSNSPDNNQGSNRPADLQRTQNGHLLLQVVERKPLNRGPSVRLQSIFSYNRVSRSLRAKSLPED